MSGIRLRMKKHVGPHTMRLNGEIRTITPGMTITCEKELLANAIDKFDQLDPDPPLPQPTMGLTVEAGKVSGYNVISGATKKPINTTPLTREEAYATAGLPLPPKTDDKKGSEQKPKVDDKPKDDKSGDSDKHSPKTKT